MTTAEPASDQAKNAEGYAISEVEGEEAFLSLRGDWERLWNLSNDATQFQSWPWQYLYWKHVTPNTTPRIVVVRAPSTNEVVALGAFSHVRDRTSGVSKIAFISDKLSDYHMFLAKPGLPEELGIRLLEFCRKQGSSQAAYVELSNIPQESWLGGVLERQYGTVQDKTVEYWQTETFAVPLPATLDEYLATLGSRSRRDFAYDRRRLSKDAQVDYAAHETFDDFDAVMECIEAIDKARWGDLSTYLDPAMRAFQRDVAKAFADMGIWRVFLLRVNGKPASFATAAVVRNMIKVMRIAYDPSLFGKLSVGKITNFYAIESCIARGYCEYDLTRGAESYKEWLGGKSHNNLHVRFYRSGFHRWAEGRSKALLMWLRQQEWLRNLYRKHIKGLFR